MGKPQSLRTHGKNAQAEHVAKRMSAADIRQAKNLRTKTRNAARKQRNIEANELLASTQPQRRQARIQFLKDNAGGFANERKKFAKELTS